MSYLSLMVVMQAFLMSSCITYKDVDIKGVENIQFSKFSQKAIEAIVSLKVNNPNNYNISIVKTDLELSMNGKYFGKAKVLDKIKIKKKTEDIYTFKIAAEYGEGTSLLGSMLSFAFSKNVSLNIKGTIKAKAKMLSKKIPIDITERVDR